MIAMVMGYKICKERLNQGDIKKILCIGSTQYFVDSLYSIGSSVPYLGKFTSITVNIYSICLIMLIIKEAKKNFELLNIREYQIAATQSPN